jgi:hypothetical protein
MEQTIKDIALLLGGWTVIIAGILSFISYLATQSITHWKFMCQKNQERTCTSRGERPQLDRWESPHL